MAVVPLRGGHGSIRRSLGRRTGGGFTLETKQVQANLKASEKSLNKELAKALYSTGIEVANAEKKEVSIRFGGTRRKFIEQFVPRPAATASKLVQYVMPRGSKLNKVGHSERILRDHAVGRVINPVGKKGSQSRLSSEKKQFVAIPANKDTKAAKGRPNAIIARGNSGMVPKKYNPNLLDTVSLPSTSRGSAKSSRKKAFKNKLITVGNLYFIRKKKGKGGNRKKRAGFRKGTSELILIGVRTKRAKLKRKFDFFRVAESTASTVLRDRVRGAYARFSSST